MASGSAALAGLGATAGGGGGGGTPAGGGGGTPAGSEADDAEREASVAGDQKHSSLVLCDDCP